MEPLITSLQNPRIKQAARLRDHKGRKEQNRIIIDGAREIARAMASGITFEELFVCEALCDTPESQQTLAQARQLRLPLLPVTRPVFSKLAYGERAEGLIATAVTPQRRLENLQLPDNPLVAVLEGIEKPGNVGAVLRSADGAGLSALVVANGGTDLFNPNAIRASLGAIFSVPVATASSEETLAWLRSRRLAIYAAKVGAGLWYDEARLTGPAALVLGSEAQGLSSIWEDTDVQAVKLPMLGVCDSLNVSVTAAVLFYEAWRQRRQGVSP